MKHGIHLDVRGLAPPEPLTRALQALENLSSVDRLCLLIDREPFPLYGILQDEGYHYATKIGADDHYEICIWR